MIIITVLINKESFMKKITCAMFVLSLFGCNFPVADMHADWNYGRHIAGHELYDIDFGYVDNGLSLEDDIKAIVTDIIRKQITHTHATSLHVREVEEIWKSGKATCQEFCLVLANILYFARGVEICVALEDYYAREIVEGGIVNHASNFYEGKYYSGQSGVEIFPGKVGYIYGFWEV